MVGMQVEKDNGGQESGKEDSKVVYRGWKVMPLVIGNETFEKLGTIGTLSNLLIYLSTVFNVKSVTAATIVTVFKGASHFGTLIGAYLSDTYFGRYKTIGFSSIAALMGLLAIQLTAAISKLHPPDCSSLPNSLCEPPTQGQIAFLAFGFVLMVIGGGGIKPCNLAFGADQFDPNTESGKKGINSFFNWYFFTFTFAEMISLTLVVYVQSNVSWAIGLAIPAALMFLACVLYFGGSRLYVKIEPSGSPMTSVAQVVVVALKKRKLKSPRQPWLTLHKYISPTSMNSELPYTRQFRCLDKAAIVTQQDKVNPDGAPEDPWSLCTMQQVEEVKCLMRVIPIWSAAFIFYLAIVQQHTYTVFQALQSDRRLGSSNFKIPAATYVVFMMLCFTLAIPFYDRLLVPFLVRITGKEGGITLLQRIGVGLVMSILTMLVSGFVEVRRRHLALTKPTLGIASHKGQISSMSGLWLIPQLSLAGLAEVFGSVGQVEFYYKQFPENMRSIAGSLFFCGMAISSFLNGFLISIVHSKTEGSSTGNWLQEDLNKGRLELFYYMIVGLGILNFGYFLVCSKWYRYKQSCPQSATPL